MAEAETVMECDDGKIVETDGCSADTAEERGVGESGAHPTTELQIADSEPGPSGQDAVRAAPPHVSLTPPEDCIQVTPDGGVLKKILEPGEPGEKPSLHARCLIHYVGYLVSTGEMFMDTRKDRETEEAVIVVAGRNSAAQETGLSLAAATMTKGEKALVYIQDPLYGYGKMGSFSFPCVPPESRLVYDVEMVNWEGIEETDNDHNRGTLLFEERLERAERRRETGNELYKEGKYKDALAKYALALSYMDEDFMYQLEGHYLDKAEAVKLRIHLNMAASQLNTGDYNTAIYNCGQVLGIDANNVKAFFRRGKARHALGRTEEALQDLEAALKIDPADKAIISEMHAIRGTIKKERQAEATLFKGRLKLGPGPAEAAVAASTPSGLEADTAGAAGQLSKRTASTAGKAGSAGAKQAAGAAAARGPRRQQGVQSRGGVLGSLLGLLAWLWSLLLAAVGVGRRRPVTQPARGR